MQLQRGIWCQILRLLPKMPLPDWICEQCRLSERILNRELFALCVGRSIRSGIQLQLVPWLVAISGLQWKSTLMPVVREMLAAIIDSNHYLGYGVTCAEESKLSPLGFLELAKRAKTAPGNILSIVLEHGKLLMRHLNRR